MMFRLRLTALGLALLWTARTAHAQPAPASATPPDAPSSAEPGAAEPGAAEPSAAQPPAAGPVRTPLHHRLALELELFADAAWIRRAGPDLTQLRLDRGEAGATIGLGPSASAELRLQSIRSAADGGALGVDGDSLVVRVKRAQVYGGGTLGDVRLAAVGGLVADPWIEQLEDGYTARPLSPTASERLLDWQTSDLAVRGSVALGPARLTASFGNGEGLRYPERNTGKTTTAVLEVRPVDTATTRLRLAAMVRDGSLGPASVRAHRAGGSATLVSPAAGAGLELVRAWGIGDAGAVKAWVAGGWAELRPATRMALAARAATIGYTGGGRHTTAGGALAFEPWRDAGAGRLRLWLALDRTSSSGAARPLPGSDPGDATTLMLVVSATAPFSID